MSVRQRGYFTRTSNSKMKPLRAKQQDTKLKSTSRQDSVFSCEICAKNFQHKGSYTDHLKTHANYDVKYECSECPCFFKNAGHLSVHIREAHNNDPVKKVFDCKTCSKNFSSRQSLTEHKRQQHPALIVVFNCKFCQRPYSSKNSLKWHINLNHNKDFKRSKCPYCPCDFKWPHHLKVHIRKAHIEKGHAPTDLLKNGLTSIRRKTNNCIVCREKFQKKLDLMVHLKCVHKQELDIYKCCRCHAVFTLGNSLKIHLDEHRRNKTGFEDHQCDQCHPVSSPKLFETGDKPEPEVKDERTEIEKEVIDFELSLMEHEDIRELIKYRIRHAKRPKRKRKSYKPDANSDFEEFYETFVDKDVTVKDDSDSGEDTKSVSPIINGKGKYYCEKCKLHFQMRFSYVTHLKDHTDTESQASTDTIEEAKVYIEGLAKDNEVITNNVVETTEKVVKINKPVKTENKSSKFPKKRESIKRKINESANTPTETAKDEKDVVFETSKADIAKKSLEDNNAINETPENATVTAPKSSKTAANVEIENFTAKMVLLEDHTANDMNVEITIEEESSENDDSKIDKEVRVKLARLTDEEMKPKANFECDLCDHAYALESNLEEHVRISHRVNHEDLPKRKAINSRYQCVNCNEKFSNPLALNRHMRIESQLKKMQNKTRLKKKKLTAVKREITFKCKICKTGFVDRKRYRTHVRMNHRKFEYSEPNSPKKSNVVPVSPRQLRRADKIYECGKCEIFFNSKLELLRHISDVHMYIKPRITSPKSQAVSESTSA